jgi:hypothetical protein
MAPKIAILEDNKDRAAVMRDRLADRFRQYEVRVFDESATMIRFLGEYLADTVVISLDHDLEMIPGPDGHCTDPGTGREVADFLAGRKPACPVILHTTNSDAAAGMEMVLRDARWKTRRVVPFGDLEWIDTLWFPAVRRAIVGPVRRPAPPRSRS